MAAPSYSFSWLSEARSVTAASGSSMSILGGFLDDAGGDCGPETTLGDLIASSGPDLRGLCSRAIAMRVVRWAPCRQGGEGGWGGLCLSIDWRGVAPHHRQLLRRVAFARDLDLGCRVLDLAEVSLRELDGGSADILLKPVELGRAGDR